MAVFVLDRQGKAVMPCSEKRARLLLERGRARVHRLVPFVIRLVDRQQVSCQLQPLQVKLDPGSKATGLALVREVEQADVQTGEIRNKAVVLNLFELGFDVLDQLANIGAGDGGLAAALRGVGRQS